MEKGAVMLLDILGWKGVWQRNPNAIKDLKKIFQDSIEMAETLILSNNNDDLLVDLKHFTSLDVKLVSISDTIALSTYGDFKETIEIQALIASFMFTEAIKNGLPLRGAMAYGEFLYEENVFLGPAIDEVSAWYEAANWIGVVLTPSAAYKFNEEKLFHNLLLKYLAPIKQIGSYETYCLNWGNFWYRDSKEELENNEFEENRYLESEQLLKDSLIKMGPITPDVALKFANSLKFYEQCSKNLISYPRKDSLLTP